MADIAAGSGVARSSGNASFQRSSAMHYRPFGTLRFCLALMVLLWHCAPFVDVSADWFSTTRFGAVAVFVFFVLSGYIITEAIYFYYSHSPGRFLINRFVRL